MFSFFGAFTDADSNVPLEFRRRWSEVDIVEINSPFRGHAIRFHSSVYYPENEDIPEEIISGVLGISRDYPNVRIVLLRTECWGGICGNWGQFILGGTVRENFAMEDDELNSKGVLRKLISNFGVDIGEAEIFEPLSRSFAWEASS